MSGELQIREVLKIAMKIEQNGENFYKEYAERSASKEIKEVFNFLAAQEVEHYRRYERMLKTLKPAQIEKRYPGRIDAYLKALAKESVFKKDKEAKAALDRIDNDREALEFAKEIEVDSIIFYEQMKKTLPFSEKKVIKEIIVEEERHLKMIEEMTKKFQ